MSSCESPAVELESAPVGAFSEGWIQHVPKDLYGNLRFRAKVATVCETDRQARADVRQMCAEDLLFFVNVFCWTLDPRKLSKNSDAIGACLPFISWAEFQDSTLLKINEWIESGEDGLIEKSRDMGASWMVCVVFLWRWLFQDHQSYLMVSRKEALVDGDEDSLFSHLDFVLKRLPLWLLPPKSYDRTKLYLKNHENGSVIEGESTTENIGRGGRRTAILLDEFPAFEGGGFEALSATADTTRCRLLNGTPKGTANAFFAQREKGTDRIRLHWSRHPEKKRGLYRPIGQGQFEKLDTTYDYSKTQFVDEVPRGGEGFRSPWYDRECKRRAHAWEIAQELDIDYQGSAYPFFDPRTMDELRVSYCSEPVARGMVSRISDEESVFVAEPKGGLSLWCRLGASGRPPSGREYVVGCDVSQGTGSSDSAASVLDMLSGEKVAELVGNKWGVDKFARLVVDLCYFFRVNGTLPHLIWEATGPGRTLGKIVVEDLKYPRFYMNRDETKLGNKPTDKYGWYSGLDRKRDLLQTYRELLTSRRFLNPSAHAMREAGFYVYEGGRIEYRGPSSAADPSNRGVNHGDCVIADALCAKLLFDFKGGKIDPYEPAKDPPVLSLAWRRENWGKKADDETVCLVDREW